MLFRTTHRLHKTAPSLVAIAASLSLPGLLSPSLASVVYVNLGATGLNTGQSWPDAFTDLQSAFAAAVAGDQIWIAKGVYRPTVPNGNREVSFVLKTGVEVYGGFVGGETQLSQRDWRANATVLSGDLNGNDGPNFAGNSENSYHVVYASGVLATCVVDGVVVSGGNANGSLMTRDGGGVWMGPADTFPVFRNCIVEKNRCSGWGAGVYAGGSDPLFTDCEFRNNRSDNDGGGADSFNGKGSYVRCVFRNNRAAYGGGLVAHGQVQVSDCLIENNVAEAHGGGVFMGANGTLGATLRNCRILGNTAGFGGGVYLRPPNLGGILNAQLVGCIIARNIVPTEGGGVLCKGTNLTVVNCTITANIGATTFGNGIDVQTSSSARSHAVVRNCIVWGNTGSVQIRTVEPSTTDATRNDIQNGFPGIGNFSADPLMDPSDFTLRGTSACIDSGNNTAVPQELTVDVWGLPRFRDDAGMANSGVPGGAGGQSIVDLGACEFDGTTCYGNCDTSTIPPLLNVNDFQCFLTRFAGGDPYSNCDASTIAPVLNVNDFSCFLNKYAAGCP